MHVTSKRGSRAPHRGARRGAAGPREQAVAWARQIAALLASADPTDRERGMAGVARDLEAALEPYLTAGEMLEAFRREAETGRLRSSPEARLCLARERAARGDRPGAEAWLWSAIRLAEGAGRARAAAVNRAASLLFYEIGDAYQGHARHVVARCYSVPPEHRSRLLCVPWFEGDGAAMGAPSPRVPPPPRSRTGRREPPLPPAMEGRSVAIMNLVDLLNQIGAHIGLLRDSADMSRALAAADAIRLRRDTLPPPPRPRYVGDMRDEIARLAHHPDARVREAARRALDATDFNLLHEAARAYWGE